ncbi:Okp1p KNAG_0H02630 [Huiozyma naganishii CBS 8797]|uniref:Uncharacterized protein n=1 Tax=Huiozyma naganishii (strain ATCC MYA-139 / BCRC 22969 / CBS 8797 / KCTC 17520 / NBRC 10181 / NCYC 3082 / Yp74L-3) TaxID=1071383 RepID=J7RPM1_HUIN7|nr:hypothetical protein KNAG_0H02630 [Kazachstania naganishii CBS 8797]CCK71678.1 hypothetical protein KNAG_0H02630 [Kazachstania naganishii CBS 8797]
MFVPIANFTFSFREKNYAYVIINNRYSNIVPEDLYIVRRSSPPDYTMSSIGNNLTASLSPSGSDLRDINTADLRLNARTLFVKSSSPAVTPRDRPFDDFALPINPSRVTKKRGSKAPRRTTQTQRTDPWDFKSVVRDMFNDEILRDQHIDIKSLHWRRTPDKLRQCILRIVEGNIEHSLEETFAECDSELNEVLNYDRTELDKVHKVKRKLMGKIVEKMSNKLEECRFPAEVNGEDLDIEYVFAKRKYIQEKHQQELQDVERLELEIIKERNKLRETKDLLAKLKTSDTKILKDNLLKGNLHPLLNTALQNTYGLMTDPEKDETDRSRVSPLSKDIAKFNLVIPTRVKTTLPQDPEHSRLAQSKLPALAAYEGLSAKLNDTLATYLEKAESQTISEFLANQDSDRI